MAKNIYSGGVDFDDLFDPDVVGNGTPAAWLTSAGVPLRYAHISYGTKRADVGFRDSAGNDLSNYWAAKGTAVYNIAGLHGKNLNAGDNALTNQPTVVAQVFFSLNNNGTWSVGGGNSHGAVAQSPPTSGTWLPAGAAVSDFQVQFVVASGGSGQQQITNGAAAYAALTTGRGVTLSLPSANAANANERDGWATVTIHLKRLSTGSISTSSLSMNVSTVGYA